MPAARRRVSPFLFIAPAAIIAALPACRVPKTVYGPAGNNVATAPSGQAAAVYDVSFGPEKAGQIQVWSDGVMAGGRPETTDRSVRRRPRAFGLGFLLRDDSDVPLTMKPQDVHLHFENLPELTPRERTTVSVAPRQSEEVLLEYPLPGRFADRPPDDYEVIWAVHFGTTVYHQRTSFNRDLKRGVVPRPLDSSSMPTDQPYIEGTDKPAPVGIPFGSDPHH